ncbi:MAG TPA: molybdate ABC transporter substrate-binding protein [Bryobacteraceae bacterium]|nr:molybdate ABC transporter substrate-binding protein [Bryobacteraceae bacterium]
MTVAAAADLADLQTPLVQSFEKQAGIHVTVTLGASGILRQQIENGAPYDVFLSANEQYVRDLAARGVVDPASVRIYALGRLGLWSRDSRFRDVSQLQRPDLVHLAIANPEHAPYGAAARDFLQRRGIWDAVRSRVVYGENVRQALQFAETGNADAVITAWSLLVGKPDAVLLPPDHAPIRQALGIVASSVHKDSAREFERFLFGPEGRKLLIEHGLMPAQE